MVWCYGVVCSVSHQREKLLCRRKYATVVYRICPDSYALYTYHIYIVFFDLYTYIHTVCIHFAWDWEICFSTHSKFASPNLFAFESFMLHQQSPVFALHTQVLQISRHSWHVSVGYKSIHTDRTANKNLWNLRFCKRWWSCKGQMGICWFFSLLAVLW